MNIKEIRNTSTDILLKSASRLKQELFALRFKGRIGKLDKSASIKNKKREIARIFTILNERDENIDFGFHKVHKQMIQDQRKADSLAKARKMQEVNAKLQQKMVNKATASGIKNKVSDMSKFQKVLDATPIADPANNKFSDKIESLLTPANKTSSKTLGGGNLSVNKDIFRKITGESETSKKAPAKKKSSKTAPVKKTSSKSAPAKAKDTKIVVKKASTQKPKLKKATATTKKVKSVPKKSKSKLDKPEIKKTSTVKPKLKKTPKATKAKSKSSTSSKSTVKKTKNSPKKTSVAKPKLAKPSSASKKTSKTKTKKISKEKK